MYRFRYGLFCLFAGVLLMSAYSCSVSKYLGPDEYLVKGNKIKFDDPKNIPGLRALKYELSTLYKQTPNRRFLFTPREWYYYATQGPGDTTFLDRFQQRVLAEKPVIFDDTISQRTADAMTYYLHYKGFYQAKVEYEKRQTKRKKAYVTYYVSPAQQYIIDSVTYESRDTAIEAFLQRTKRLSPLQRGRGLDLSLFEQDKARITNALRQQGYAYFYDNAFDLIDIDTSQAPGKANLYINVLPPPTDSTHQQYEVGKIHIYLDYDPVRPPEVLYDTLIGGVHFMNPDSLYFSVKPQTILKSLYLRPGERYNQDLFDKTNQQLSALGIYSFVRIRQDIDSTQKHLLDFRIELTPNKKIELGLDFQISYTNRSATSGLGNLIGFTLSPRFTNRNLLRGAELLVTNLSSGVEVNPDPNISENRFWNTIDLRVQSDLYLPKFQDYLLLWRNINKVPFGKQKKIVSDKFYQDLSDKATTRISASYNYILILDWYRYNLFNGSYGYEMQRTPMKRYLINHIGIDFLNPKTEARFDSLLSGNDFLARSFGQQVFVSLLFRDLNYVKNSRVNRFGESHYFGFSLEMAGAEIYAANALYNEFSTNLTPEVFKIGEDINFSQYVRAEFDGRYYRQFQGGGQSIATRFSIGIARPFGYTSDVPYVKQFYVGGANSIRAWAPRGLGPGGYLDTLSLNPGNRVLLYQTGDLKMEFNFEYRFDIISVLKGALFIDGGNIWTARRDPNRSGSQFLLRRRVFDDTREGDPVNEPFYRQIAIGTGFGLRFDFSYFIFRLDMGIKLRNPYPTPGRDENERVPESAFWETHQGFGLRSIAFNLGLGYPF